MARLNIPKSLSRKPKSIKVKDFMVPNRSPSGIPSLQRPISSSKKSKPMYASVPKDTFGKMQPAMQTAFEVLGTFELLNQEFMRKPILMPQPVRAGAQKKEKTESLLSELL